MAEANAEQRELEELTQMIHSSGGSASLRDSPITASKYNKWLIGEQNRDTGASIRVEGGNLRMARRDFNTRHISYGASLRDQAKQTMQRNKQIREMTREQHLAAGEQVKSTVQAFTMQAEKQKQEWIAHGKNLAMKDQLQRQKIKQVCGENSKRVAEMTAKAKQEELDYERELAGVRQKLLQDNKAEVEKVRNETSDEVIDASKEFAFEQRKSIAFATKAAEAAWNDERKAHTKAHIAKAKANKADAEASRAKAKQLREEIAQTRREVANAARKQQQSNMEQKAKIIMFSAGGVKDTHDQIYKKKYVPADAAERMTGSKYATSVA
jgi:hypothetical protein